MQIRIRSIKGIPRSILVKREDLTGLVLADDSLTKSFFVNVISEVDQDIQILLSQMTIGGVVTVLVILARNKRKTELGGRLGRRRAGSANGTDFSTSHKAVPIVSSRAKSVDFRVNGMTEFL